jgi:hypothetical protein
MNADEFHLVKFIPANWRTLLAERYSERDTPFAEAAALAAAMEISVELRPHLFPIMAVPIL